MKTLGEIRNWAAKHHAITNHFYDGKRYSFHLAMVASFARKYLHLVPDQTAHQDILCACWCHDLIEDCRQTYNDVKQNTNQRIAEIVYACTNEKGKTRSARANDKYYQGIRDMQYASFVKICDRMANIKHSVNSQSSMLKAYKLEHKHFLDQLYRMDYEPMFAEMQALLNA